MTSPRNVFTVRRISPLALLGLCALATLLTGCASDGGKSAGKASDVPAPANTAASHTQRGAPVRGTPITKPAAAPSAPTATSSPEPEPPSRADITVQFGIMPGNYEDTAKGVLVGGVTPGTSADAAGIKAGDRLMTWNGREIADVESWMTFLVVAKPGDVVDVGVNRDGKTVPMKVTLKARQD